MRMLLCIDPGPTESAWLVYNGQPVSWGMSMNQPLIGRIRSGIDYASLCTHLACESMAPRGMPTSKDEMETLIWIGRFIEAWSRSYTLIPRHQVKMAICGRSAAKDSNVRQALIDRFGGNEKAIGSIKCDACKGRKLVGRGKERGPCEVCAGSGWRCEPGPLRGISGHCWAALAIGVAWQALP